MCGDRMVVISEKQDTGLKRVTYLAPSWARLCEVWDFIDVAVDRRDMWSTPVAHYCNNLINTLVVDVPYESQLVLSARQPGARQNPLPWSMTSISILVSTRLVGPPCWQQSCDILVLTCLISLQFEDRLCGLVVIGSGYGPRGSRFDSRRVQIIWEAVGLELAEKWLKEQAQALGWSKATKLAGRPTLQGVVAVSVDKNSSTIVEVNCETDFVARNKNFQSLVRTIADACAHFTKKQPLVSPITKVKINLKVPGCITLGVTTSLYGTLILMLPADSRDKETSSYILLEFRELLRMLKLFMNHTEDGKLLVDHMALHIGNLGENLSLRRAFCFLAEEGVTLAGYTHPAAPIQTGTLLGKYGALVALRENSPETHIDKAPGQLSTEQLGKQLCQHIVGMSPTKLEEVGVHESAANPDDELLVVTYRNEPHQSRRRMSPTKLGEAGVHEPAANPDDEQCMIYQEYLLDPTITVAQLLADSGVSLIDFVRFECGEELEGALLNPSMDLAAEVGG
uniref:Elongation factor Ts, mitochondrial n=1 Tax=Timema shepardi TaxID=629360 RepID=A0A7R9B574_TIMSH|nr:unnamed protein product [Timema shepardi]